MMVIGMLQKLFCMMAWQILFVGEVQPLILHGRWTQ